MQLITYVDRLAGDLPSLKELLDNEFAGLFTGVHLLPFYTPIDGVDAGFDPDDHTQVDQRLGTWSDLAIIGADYCVMADLIVNHMSSNSLQFQDVRKHGTESPYWDLFLKKTDVFDDIQSEDQIAKIYRPRPTPPFTALSLEQGREYEFWTTFSENQIDINVESPVGQKYIDSILNKFEQSNVQQVRLDAAGYAIKRKGSSCFMLPETFEFIGDLSTNCSKRNLDTLVEVHSHYQTQVDIAANVSRVYDFALPPLVLHSIYTQGASALKKWLQVSPRNCFTVLDTHDGIGIVDIARDGSKLGLINDEELNELVETIHTKSGQTSRQASGEGSSNLDIYQVNSTFYDALGQDDTDYLIARSIQFFAPGEPQVYYAGLLASANDMSLFQETGVGRDVNRPHFTKEKLKSAIQQPVVQSLMALISVRNSAAAFEGDFSLEACPDHELKLRWSSAGANALLAVDFNAHCARIEIENDDAFSVYQIENGEFSSAK